MDTKNARRLEYMLGGDFSDFPEESIQEAKNITESSTFLEAFSNVFDAYNSYELNETDIETIDSLEINEELAAIQEALDSIRSKMCLSESISDLLPVAGAVIPGLAAGASAIIGLMARKGIGDGKILPTPLANVLHDIKQFVTKGKEKERREIIASNIRGKYPKITKEQVDMLVDYALKNADKESARPVPKDSAKHGTYETDFAKINKKRFGLE
jgi:hypothetical protein